MHTQSQESVGWEKIGVSLSNENVKRSVAHMFSLLSTIIFFTLSPNPFHMTKVFWIS
jgi:hypothetical protein